MGLIAKFAWIALTALAGCGVLSQVASQGTGTNPEGKARVAARSNEQLAALSSGHRFRAFQPAAVKHLPLFDGLDVSKNPTPYNFGISEQQFIPVIDAVVGSMRDPSLGLPPLSQRDEKQEILDWIAKVQAPKIKAMVDGVIASEYPGKPSQFVKEWLYSEASIEWTRLYIAYDDSLYRNALTNGRAVVRGNKLENSMSQTEPSTVCGGFSGIARNLLRGMGVKAFELSVFTRGFGQAAPRFDSSELGHSVLLVKFSNGQVGVSDTARGNVRHIDPETGSRPSFADWLSTQDGRKADSHLLMPRTAVQWELFLRRNTEDRPYKSGIFSANRDYQKDLWVSRMRYPTWASLADPREQDLEREYRAAEGR